MGGRGGGGGGPTSSRGGRPRFDFAPRSAEQRIIDAYFEINPPGDRRRYVSMDALRDESGVSRAEFDAAIRQLHRTSGVNVIPQEDQKRLTDANRRNAVVVGPSAKHLVQIER